MPMTGGSARFYRVLLTSVAIGVAAVSILGILVTLGVLPASLGLVFIVVVVGVVVWFGRSIFWGETVRMYQNVTPKSQLIANTKTQATVSSPYVVMALFGLLMLAGVFYWSAPTALDDTDYIFTILGVLYVVVAVYAWIRRYEISARSVKSIEAQSSAQLIAKQRSVLIGAVSAVSVGYVLERFGWPFYAFFVAFASIGVTVGFIIYRTLLRRYLANG